MSGLQVSRTWRALPDGLRWSPGAEGLLRTEEVVGGEGAPSRGRGRAAQLLGAEAGLQGARAGPREAVGVLLPVRVRGVPGACGRVNDSRDVVVVVVVPGEVIRGRKVLTVQRQRLSRVSHRLGVGVHAGVLGVVPGRDGESEPLKHDDVALCLAPLLSPFGFRLRLMTAGLPAH